VDVGVGAGVVGGSGVAVVVGEEVGGGGVALGVAVGVGVSTDGLLTASGLATLASAGIAVSSPVAMWPIASLVMLAASTTTSSSASTAVELYSGGVEIGGMEPSRETRVSASSPGKLKLLSSPE